MGHVRGSRLRATGAEEDSGADLALDDDPATLTLCVTGVLRSISMVLSLSFLEGMFVTGVVRSILMVASFSFPKGVFVTGVVKSISMVKSFSFQEGMNCESSETSFIRGIGKSTTNEKIDKKISS